MNCSLSTITPPPLQPIRNLGVLILLSLFATGCVSMGPPQKQESSLHSAENLNSDEVEARLQRAAERWDQVPHQLGGESLQGVDCSGLVQSVFEEELSVRLPRTAAQQAQAGQTIDRSALQPGDLVFFRPSWRDHHVGIYLSEGTFLHASSSQGVTTSSLDSDYWTERWSQARRVLSFSDDSDAAADSSSVSPTQRNGW